MFKMAPGVTLQQAEQALLADDPTAGAAQVTAVAGVVGLGPKQDAWLDLDLTPGNYLMFCFFPDPKQDNVPHFVEGMYKVVTIA